MDEKNYYLFLFCPYAFSIDSKRNISRQKVRNIPPVFNYMGIAKTIDQWQALGYDTHSKVINPDSIDFTDFAPATRPEYGTDSGSA